MPRPKKIKTNIFTDHLRVSAMILDISSEVIFIGKYFDILAGAFVPYQMICDVNVFSDLIARLASTHPDVFNRITDAVAALSEDPVVIGRDCLPPFGLSLSGGIFALTPLEFYSAGRDKFLDALTDPLDQAHIQVKIDEDRSLLPSKLDLTRPTLNVVDFVPCKMAFNPRKHWLKDINDNHRFLALANQLYYLQMRYRFYLYLRSTGTKINHAKRISCLRPRETFTLARTIYSLSANPNNFTPD